MKVLLRLLCLALVPVLIVTVPTTAEAATVKGPSVPTSLDTGEGAPPGSDQSSTAAKCNVNGQWIVSDQTAQVAYSASCSTGFNAQDPKLRFYPSGGGCTVQGGADYATPEDISTGAWYVGGGENCTVTEICWDYTTSFWSNPWDTSSFSGCAPWALGPQPEGAFGEDCPHGTPEVAIVGGPRKINDYNHWVLGVSIAGTQGTLAMNQWQYGIVVKHNGVRQTWWVASGAPGSGVGGYFSPAWPNTYKRNFEEPWETVYTGYLNYTNTQVLGVQVAQVTNFPGASSNIWRRFGNVPQESPVGTLGVTNPGECTFYFGSPIADPAAIDALNDPDATGPVAPLGDAPSNDLPAPDPAPAQQSCDFSWTDPTTWAGGGICMLVSLFTQALDLLGSILGKLGELLSAIWGLAADIASAIINGIRDLFLPSDGYLDAQVTGLKRDFKDTAPGGYVDAVTGQDYGVTASGCSGINADWTIAGRSHSFDFLEACGGFMANIAAIVKLAASALLVIFGGLACVRAVGAGFGWSPTIGRGAEV